MTGKVQTCGCIALPKEFQEKTGLYPGAAYDLVIAPDGKGLVVSPLDTDAAALPTPAAQCCRWC